LEDFDRFREAGAIARRVRDEACRMISEGIKVIEICEAVEDMIRAQGARPAFPCNIGINEVAAHYTPPPGDTLAIPPRSIVKIDLGVSLDGYLADTAATVALAPELEPLAEAARMALYEAVRAMRPGVEVSEIGYVVQRTATMLGFKPIRNLTGHEIRRFELHAGTTIPNIAAPCPGRLRPGHVYAIEPFVTTMRGSGEVVSAKFATIFRVNPGRASRPGRLGVGEQGLIKLLIERFDGLPYTPRWIDGFERVREIHDRLSRIGWIESYPVLVERRGEPVAQAEHTVIVLESGCEVIT